MQETAETEGAQIEVFLNSVPILQKLSAEERSRLAGALEEQVFKKEQRVVHQVRRHAHNSIHYLYKQCCCHHSKRCCAARWLPRLTSLAPPHVCSIAPDTYAQPIPGVRSSYCLQTMLCIFRL